ncbi:putative ABC exporter domain-containing protein [Cecembia rubra]|uniref:putative ABC exporter domain-containing protein n=1 Tax=Cecembia rubra TaxID=1485585 RepID=UPI0027147E47|nr:putative ABC exporter domain-containing protein [Cecembia rubra]
MNEFRLLLRKDIFILVNNIKLIFRNPARLLPYLFVIGYIGFFYTKGFESSQNNSSDDIEEVSNILTEIAAEVFSIRGGITVAALIILMFQLFKATKKNISFFSMADVNLLFTSPVAPANILLYYMLRSLIPALGGSAIFFIYITASVNQFLDLNILKILAMALSIGLFIFILSPIKFLLYTLNTKYHIYPLVKKILVIFSILLGVMILIPGLRAEKFWEGMFAWVGSPWFDFFPLVGWSRAMVLFLDNGDILKLAGFTLAYVMLSILLIKLVIIHSGQYYEDVLESTKSKEENKEKVKSQEVSEATYGLNTKKKLEISNFGQGAVALYWRNYVNGSRLDYHPLAGLYTLIFAGIALVLALLSRFDLLTHKFLYGYLVLLVSIYFLAGLGKTNLGDMKKPFFILIPASWGSKFWNLIKLDIYQTLILGILTIVPAVIIAELHWGLILVFPLLLLLYYLTGFGVALVTNAGFEESWDRKLIKPLIISGVFFFGIIPSFLSGVFAFIISDQFVYGLLGMCIGMSLVTAIMLHLIMDIISRVEFKEA